MSYTAMRSGTSSIYYPPGSTQKLPLVLVCLKEQTVQSDLADGNILIKKLSSVPVTFQKIL